MPLFLELHDLPEGITAKHIAEMHQANVDQEHKYNCRGLTYWYDEKIKTAFCLIEAPNKQAVIDLHEKVHGGIPTRIIVVNDTVVESFLGRIEDPEKSKNISLNIINDPAFRIIMVVKIINKSFRVTALNTLKTALIDYNNSIKTLTSNFNGRIVKQEATNLLISFNSVTDAIHGGLRIQEVHKTALSSDIVFKIGISAEIPVTDKEEIFEDCIKISNFLSAIVTGNFSITIAVKDLYESENQNKQIQLINKDIQIVNHADENFIKQLMIFIENKWTYPSTNVNDFEENLGYSKSKLYRSMMQLVGKSPNLFLRDYRLNKALELLKKQSGNISEIAYQTGFSSPAYFSKCFQKKYGILPSNFYI